LQQESKGGDVVLSDILAGDPAMANVLQGVSLKSGAAQLKGFDEPIGYKRLGAPA
jgi:hypothetical protein